MNMLESIRAGQLDYTQGVKIEPTHCQLSYEEGFDLLSQLLKMTSMNFTYLQEAEIAFVIREKDVPGLIKAFSTATVYGMKVTIKENA